jgi:predicted transcriptional regulator of viral defense system
LLTQRQAEYLINAELIANLRNITKSVMIDHMAISEAPMSLRMSQAADWALSHGVGSLTTSDAANLLHVPETQVPQRMASARKRGEWITPSRGLWVPVAPEFRAWGGPPATEFIRELMKHLEIDHYYVGWLMAASFHGAAHHAPQVTHVATSKLVRSRAIGRVRLVFHQRSDIDQLPLVERMSRSGGFYVSSPEVTAFDLASNIRIAGGLNNAATVITELGEEAGLNEKKLTQLVPLFSEAAARRIGWIIESNTEQRLDDLAAVVNRGGAAPSRLHPSKPLVGELDERWNLKINAAVDVE